MAIRYVSSQDGSIQQQKQQPQLPEQQEDNGLLRTLSGLGARAVEGLGAPFSALSSLYEAGANAKQQISQAAEKQGHPFLASLYKEGNQPAERLLKANKEFGPTSENIKKGITEPISEKITGKKGYLEPKNNIEESLQNISYTVGALFNPLNLIFGGAPSISRAIGQATAGEGARVISKIFGAGPIGQTIAEFAGMTLAGSAGARKGLKNKADNDFTITEKLAPQFSGNPDKLAKVAQQGLKKLHLSDIPLESKQFLTDRYQSLLNLAESGESLNTEQALQRYREINDWLRNPDIPRKVEKSLGNIKESLREFIQDTGRSSKEFSRAFNESNQVYAALQSVSNLSQFLQKHLPLTQISNPTTRKFFESMLAPAAYGAGTLALGALGGIKGLALAAGGGLSVRQLYKTYKLIQQSPVARKYYIDLLSSAAKQNASAVIANTKRLEKEIDRLEKQDMQKIQRRAKSQGISYRKH